MIATVLAGGARLVSGSSIRSVSGIPDKRQRIYIANHSSHLDFVVLWSHLPPEVRRLTRPVAAADYWGHGFRRYLVEQVFHAILIERHVGARGLGAARSARESIGHLVEAMGERYSLIVFPEGTRSETGEVGPFRTGLYFLCAARPDVDVLPVYMENLNRILPKGEVLPVPMLSRITFGQPLHLEQGEERHAFVERARAAVVSLRAANLGGETG